MPLISSAFLNLDFSGNKFVTTTTTTIPDYSN